MLTRGLGKRGRTVGGAGARKRERARDSEGSSCWTVNYIFEINADSAADGVKRAAAACCCCCY